MINFLWVASFRAAPNYLCVYISLMVHFHMEVVIIKIGFIGAGKVGFSLGKFFKEKNLNVSGYFSKNPESSKEASVFTNTKHFKSIEDLVNESNIIFITVPDNEILNVYSELKSYPLKDKIICHTSGCLSSNIFSDIDNFGAYSYSIHPMFPISQKKESYKYLKDAFFTIEGSYKYLKFMIDLFSSIGVKIISIDSKNKPLYHLASVTASNLFLALFNRSCDYLKQCGFEENDAVNALYPLIKNNIENIFNVGVINALTGPIERGDINTVKEHIAFMPKEHKKAYCELSKELILIAKNKNKNRDYSDLEKYFEEIDKESYAKDLNN